MTISHYSLEEGYNSRLDEIHAAMLRIKLKGLDAAIARRREIATRYSEALSNSPYDLPITAPGNEHAYYLYVVRHPERDRILEQLKLNGILLNISYPWPIHTMPGYAHLGYVPGELPNTETVATEIFSLPMYPGLKPSEQEEVITALLQLA